MAHAEKKPSSKKPKTEHSIHRTSDGSGNTQLATQLGSVESTSMMQLWSQERDLNQLPFSEWQANQTSSHNSYHYQNGYGSNSNGY
ncbi:hypothetical protein MCOR07_008151 [Pyricularia oryzae]|nr:hypothetical protein MCOR21_008137 [Pyricularia oryzae]KAI6515780.1 hypothetical protein MCOR10_008008 [Pyricularia oryzae]KAI6615421.1 hypothetical protein MCOR07_008151 [Pyricularia oryzae]